MTVEAARITMMSRRSAHDELRREGEARVRRLQEVTKEVATWRHRLETAGKRIAELGERKAASEEELATASGAPEEIAAERAKLADAIDEAEVRRKAAADKLAVAETALRDAVAGERDAERTASEAREGRARAEARADAAKETVAQAAERIVEEQETTPDKLLEELDVVPDQMPSVEHIETDVNRLKRTRDALGAVNLRAEEDAREVQEEHDALVSEKTDLEEAIKKLRTGIASLNREGRERLLTAFEQVNTNFGMLFKHLFGGGEAKLVMVESDDPLEAGLEIMCQPPGKRLSTLSLLSGGEQTLTALALIFAVFLGESRPDMRSGRGRCTFGRRQRDPVLRHARRDDAADRYPVPDHHSPRGDDGADGPSVRRHDGRTGREPAGFGRSETRRADGCVKFTTIGNAALMVNG